MYEEFAGPDWDDGYRKGFADGKVKGYEEGYRTALFDVSQRPQDEKN